MLELTLGLLDDVPSLLDGFKMFYYLMSMAAPQKLDRYYWPSQGSDSSIVTQGLSKKSLIKLRKNPNRSSTASVGLSNHLVHL